MHIRMRTGNEADILHTLCCAAEFANIKVREEEMEELTLTLTSTLTLTFTLTLTLTPISRCKRRRWRSSRRSTTRHL